MSLLKKIRCWIGDHICTSYAEVAHFDSEVTEYMIDSLLEENDDITYIRAFFELSAIRCKHCCYTYGAITQTKREWL